MTHLPYGLFEIEWKLILGSPDMPMPRVILVDTLAGVDVALNFEEVLLSELESLNKRTYRERGVNFTMWMILTMLVHSPVRAPIKESTKVCCDWTRCRRVTYSTRFNKSKRNMGVLSLERFRLFG